MKTNFKKKIFYTFVVFCLCVNILALTGCQFINQFFDRNKEEVEVVREVPVFAVNTTTAVQGQIHDYIALSGDIHSGSNVDVFPEAAGRITEIYTTVGRRINRGDNIAAIDPSRPGMSFRQSIATAPISGTVIAVPAQVGMTVSQAVPLVRIAGGTGLEIRLHVAERFISKMAMNLPCEITLDAWPGDIFQGSISELSPTIDLASRTMEVRVNVRDTDSKLKPGMFAKVKIITEQKNNIVKIPATAVIRRFGEQFVFVVERDSENPEFNIVKQRNIIPGILIDGIMEIQSGLAENEEIVIRGHTLLDDGSRVNIIERVSPLSVN